MPIDVETPGSPGWWLQRCSDKLFGRPGLALPRAARLERLDAYFRGDPPLPSTSLSDQQAYRDFVTRARTNFAELIVEAPRERMTVTGFGAGSLDQSATGDAAAWATYVANDLDVLQSDVHEDMLALGDAYTIVGPPDESGHPVITAEDPRNTVTIHDPVRQSRRLAGAKFYHDAEQDLDLAYLYLPGSIWVASRPRVASSDPRPVVFDGTTWSLDPSRTVVLPAGMRDVVPVVRFRNRRGVGEFEPHTDVLDRINHMILQRVVIVTFQAFKQRALLNAPELDEQGKEIDYRGALDSDPGTVWLPPDGATLWESGQADVQGVLSATREDIQHLSSVTRTPFHMLSSDAVNQSAEGATLANEGVVFRTEDRQLRAGAGWSETLRIAARWQGADVSAPRLVTRWAPVERFSLAERYDAAVKAVSAQVPVQTVWSDILQFPPAQVDRMLSQRADDALNAALLAPAAGAAEGSQQ